MSTFTEVLDLLNKGVLLLALNRTEFLITILIAITLACLSWYLCNNYVKLWNRRFRLTTTHQVLTIIASAFTFFFALAFGGLKYMKDVTTAVVNIWESYEIKSDSNWSHDTFKLAYYKVRDLNVENFANTIAPENGGNIIPTSKRKSQEVAAEVYAKAACDHFDKAHPFLSKIIWSDPSQSTHNISGDVVRYFQQNPGSSYSADKAINIASDTIKIQLNQQTPRTVTLSRISLVILYLLVISVPLGLIGYAAYKDIRIAK